MQENKASAGNLGRLSETREHLGAGEENEGLRGKKHDIHEEGEVKEKNKQRSLYY